MSQLAQKKSVEPMGERNTGVRVGVNFAHTPTAHPSAYETDN